MKTLFRSLLFLCFATPVFGANIPINGTLAPNGPFPIVDGGSQKAVNFAEPTLSTDLATKNYVDTGTANTAYLLLAGRSGGQTANGSTLTGQSLILKGNAIDANQITISGTTTTIGSAATDLLTFTSVATGDLTFQKGTTAHNVRAANSTVASEAPGAIILQGADGGPSSGVAAGGVGGGAQVLGGTGGAGSGTFKAGNGGGAKLISGNGGAGAGTYAGGIGTVVTVTGGNGGAGGTSGAGGNATGIAISSGTAGIAGSTTGIAGVGSSGTITGANGGAASATGSGAAGVGGSLTVSAGFGGAAASGNTVVGATGGAMAQAGGAGGAGASTANAGGGGANSSKGGVGGIAGNSGSIGGTGGANTASGGTGGATVSGGGVAGAGGASTYSGGTGGASAAGGGAGGVGGANNVLGGTGGAGTSSTAAGAGALLLVRGGNAGAANTGVGGQGANLFLDGGDSTGSADHNGGDVYTDGGRSTGAGINGGLYYATQIPTREIQFGQGTNLSSLFVQMTSATVFNITPSVIELSLPTHVLASGDALTVTNNIVAGSLTTDTINSTNLTVTSVGNITLAAGGDTYLTGDIHINGLNFDESSNFYFPDANDGTPHYLTVASNGSVTQTDTLIVRGADVYGGGGSDFAGDAFFDGGFSDQSAATYGRALVGTFSRITQIGAIDVGAKVGFYGVDGAVRAGAIADAAGGVVVDVEARAALNSLLAATRAVNLIAP